MTMIETENDKWLKRINCYNHEQLTAMTNYEFYREIINNKLRNIAFDDRRQKIKKTKEQVIEYCIEQWWIEKAERNEKDDKEAYQAYLQGYTGY